MVNFQFLDDFEAFYGETYNRQNLRAFKTKFRFLRQSYEMIDQNTKKLFKTKIREPISFNASIEILKFVSKGCGQFLVLL